MPGISKLVTVLPTLVKRNREGKKRMKEIADFRMFGLAKACQGLVQRGGSQYLPAVHLRPLKLRQQSTAVIVSPLTVLPAPSICFLGV